MRPVSASLVVAGPVVEVEQLWHDRSRWASWIDGFGHVSKLDDDWPLEGSRRMWVTRVGWAGGLRGLIAETVTAQRTGEGQTVRIEDARVTGVQRVVFEGSSDATRITLEFELEPKERLAPARRWWLRRQLGESLRRSLKRFSYELAAERER